MQGSKRTFFVVATGYNEKYLPLLTEASAAGHQIALHSASHEYSDIYRGSDAYWQDIALLKQRVSPYISAESIRYLRFPGGSTNTVSRRYGGKGLMKQLKSEVEQKGYQWVDWERLRGGCCGRQAQCQHYFSQCRAGNGGTDTVYCSDARLLFYPHYGGSVAGYHCMVQR